jgi:tetratricopeptide (TPR) repeat protein
LTLNQLPSASSLNVEPLLPAKNTKPVEREKNTDVRLEQFRLKNQSSTAESIKTQKFPEPTESQLIQRTESLLKKKAYNLALQQLEKALELNSRNPYAHHLMAQILTELDEFTEAIHCCQQAIDLAQSPTAHYYLLAGIFEQQGNIKQAEQILREIIYLEPGSIVASIKLSRIYQQAGYQQQAVSMQELSFATLKQLPADKRIPELNNLTVAELMSELESAGSSGLPVKE